MSKVRLREFWAVHPDSRGPLESWYRVMTRTDFTDLNALHAVYPSADYVRPFTVFNVGGNKYRLVLIIDYVARFAKIRHVLTHAEYDRWNREGRPQ